MSPTAHRTPPRLLRGLRELYIASLLIALFAIVLGPIHSALTIRQNLSRTLLSGRLEFPVDGRRPPALGARVPVFRFNPTWQMPTGYARIDHVADGIATAVEDPGSFRWPMCPQGTIVAVDGKRAQLNVGTESGLAPGQTLNVFAERKRVGGLQLTEVDAQHAFGWLDRTSHANPLGAVATPCTIPNQVVYCGSRAFLRLEWALLILLALGFALSLIYPEMRGRAAARIGNFLRCMGQSRSPFWLVLGVPATFVLTKFLLRALGSTAARLLAAFGATSAAELVTRLPDNWLGLAAAETMAGYCYLLLWKREAPFALLRRTIRYRPVDYRRIPWKWGGPILPRDPRVLNWALHLVVVYAFSRTLVGFFSANLAAVADAGWPQHALRFESFSDNLKSLRTLLTTAPAVANLDVGLSIARVALFNVTILGCLLGYLHSTVSILWTRSIRNVDFTLTGWIVNAACYPLLLGEVVAGMHGPLNGTDPGVSDGALYYAIHWGELLLNVLYTCSILNLGKRFGVMVDKGVVGHFMYGIVRHPSYTLEPFMFLLVFAPIMSDGKHYLTAMVLLVLYWARAERDDDFMSASNPDYLAYKESVPEKFFPGIY